MHLHPSTELLTLHKRIISEKYPPTRPLRSSFAVFSKLGSLVWFISRFRCCQRSFHTHFWSKSFADSTWIGSLGIFLRMRGAQWKLRYHWREIFIVIFSSFASSIGFLRVWFHFMCLACGKSLEAGGRRRLLWHLLDVFFFLHACYVTQA